MRLEGRGAVERTVVSGAGDRGGGDRTDQVWNCMNGEGEHAGLEGGF